MIRDFFGTLIHCGFLSMMHEVAVPYLLAEFRLPWLSGLDSNFLSVLFCLLPFLGTNNEFVWCSGNDYPTFTLGRDKAIDNQSFSV